MVTPCSKSLLDIVFHDMMPTLYLGGYAPVGYIGGRAYLNLSILMTMLAAAGQGRRRLIQATGDLFGQIPDEVEIPVLPVSRWTVFTTMLPATVRNRRRIRGNVGRLDAFLATAATRCDDLLGQIRAGSPADLTACWHADLLPHLHECNLMLEAGSKRHGGDFLRIRRTLRRLVGEADTNALLLAAGPDSSGADSSGLASLGPLEGLQQLMSGQIDRPTFVRGTVTTARICSRSPTRVPGRIRVGSTSRSPRWVRRGSTSATCSSARRRHDGWRGNAFGTGTPARRWACSAGSPGRAPRRGSARRRARSRPACSGRCAPSYGGPGSSPGTANTCST